MTIPTNPFCGGTTRAGTDCHRPAGWGTDHVGFGRCKLHAGSTPTGKKHAETVRQEVWALIMEQAHPRLTRMIHLADKAESETVQFQANRDLLDRAGLGAKHVHEVTGPGGGPIPVEVRTAELLARARKMRPAKADVKRKASKRDKQAADVTPSP